VGNEILLNKGRSSSIFSGIRRAIEESKENLLFWSIFTREILRVSKKEDPFLYLSWRSGEGDFFQSTGILSVEFKKMLTLAVSDFFL